MDCCTSGVQMTKETPQTACRECGNEGRIVARRTVAHHVKSERLALVGGEDYKFCADGNCPVVYYAESGQKFTVSDVRELVSSKTAGDARPICYCFGFTEGDARKEIELTGESSAAGQVSRFIKEKLCACEIRNPSGVCCLGEINKTVSRLIAQNDTHTKKRTG